MHPQGLAFIGFGGGGGSLAMPIMVIPYYDAMIASEKFLLTQSNSRSLCKLEVEGATESE